jgi:hypothetical protein
VRLPRTARRCRQQPLVPVQAGLAALLGRRRGVAAHDWGPVASPAGGAGSLRNSLDEPSRQGPHEWGTVAWAERSALFFSWLLTAHHVPLLGRGAPEKGRPPAAWTLQSRARSRCRARPPGSPGSWVCLTLPGLCAGVTAGVVGCGSASLIRNNWARRAVRLTSVCRRQCERCVWRV